MIPPPSQPNMYLSNIRIGGGDPGDEALFYTALYHSLLHPNVFSDANGGYMGFDARVHALAPGQDAQYANYSGWDIYHSQVQLSALVAPKAMSDSAQSMLNDAAQNGGMLPKWALANAETFVMVGDPADGILAGYYAFGARDFDTTTALADMLHEATVPNEIRPGLSEYETLGYLPDDETYGCCNFYGSVATLLEYAQADFAIGEFATALGDTTDAAAMLARAQNWQNVFDPGSSLFRPRRKDGSFVPDTGSLTSTEGMVEGSASQYRWAVPFDRQPLLAAMGGAAVAGPWLDAFFTQLSDGSGTFALLTNEFELGAQYWYDETAEPWKTQDLVNRMRTNLYRQEPEFVPNNDDLGALSSQLVWSMLGFYPDYPGSGILTINGPEFPEERIALPSGNAIVIHAPGASPANPYVQALSVDGHPQGATFLDPSVLAGGSTLDFTMGPTPEQDWGSGPTDAPPSFGAESTAAIGFLAGPDPIVALPDAVVDAGFGVQSTRQDIVQDISWDVEDGGVAASPANGPMLSLGPGGRTLQAITLHAPADAGIYDVEIRLSSSTGIAMPPLVLPLVVARPGEWWPWFDNVGVSSDTQPGTGNFDGLGYSYSAGALSAAGVTPGATIDARGMTFTWPGAQPGAPDDIVCAGQTLGLPAGGPKAQLGLLGAAAVAGASGAQGTFSVAYSDGTTRTFTGAFPDWTLGAGHDPVLAGDEIAATTAYRNSSGGRDSTATYVFATTVALDATRTPVSLTLPADVSGGQMHLFDVELQ